MRYIVIPAPVQFINPRTKVAYTDPPKTFLDCAYDIWFNDVRASEAGPVALRRWMKMIDAFEAASEAGSVVALEDEDWKTLKEIVEHPKAAYPPLLAYQLDSFAAAILEATTKAPKDAGDTKEQ